MLHTRKLHQSIFIFLIIGITTHHASPAFAQRTTPSIKGTPASKPTQAVNPIPLKKMCTQSGKENWLSEEEFLLLMKHRGYVVQSFKVVYESCYEVYGFDKGNRIVEAYFNPQNAKLNRQSFVSN